MKLEFFQQNFEKLSNSKFYTNPSGRSRAVPCGQTLTNMTKPKVAVRNFQNAAKIQKKFHNTNQSYTTALLAQLNYIHRAYFCSLQINIKLTD